MIRITMIDGETIDISNEMTLVGINNASNTGNANDKTFYLEQKYIGSLNGDFEKGGSALSTTDERLGIGGFLLSHEMFTIGNSSGETIYFTSAVKSISII